MRRHGWALILGAGLGAALLVLLAVLQVRWLDQVAQTIAAQKRAALFRQGRTVAAELEREVTRAFLWFTVEDASGPRALARPLAARWQSWREASPHPGLLAGVYLTGPGPDGEGHLWRLTAGGSLEPAPWPPALAHFRALAAGGLRFAGPLPIPAADRTWLALPPEPTGAEDSGATVLVELDGRHLTRTWLPARTAAHREPGQPEGAVVAQLQDHDGHPLFGGEAPVRAGEHDPILVMGMRPELATADLVTGMHPPLRWPPDHLPPPRRVRPGAGLMVGVDGDGRAAWALGGLGGRAPGRPDRPLIMRRLFPGSPGEVGPPGHWRLVLAYSAGPVDAVVTSLRRRNLALALSALGLLGGAIAALTIAVRRAHALAEQRRQFMASMSHELRTPLAVIGAAAENLRDGTVEDAARVREYGGLIHAESRRLGAMMDHSLRLASGDQPDQALELRPVDVRAVVDAAADSFAVESKARGGQLERHQPAEPLMATADPELLRQAVENVIGNALKYGGEPPRVAVRVSRLDTPSGPELQITVEDQGLGIPADEVERVFEPFFRGSEALARQIRGTGLGLALVARVMRAHRGGASVQSTPGAGTTFVLWLPALEDPRQ